MSELPTRVKEKLTTDWRAIGAVAGSVTLLAAGCGGGKKQEGIPSCPQGYESTAEVVNQGALITAYEIAGQKLASEYKLSASSEGRKRLSVAFSQLFTESSGSQGIIPDLSSSNRHLNPDSYLADDPNELMCESKDDSGENVVVLSPNAMEAKAILKSVDIAVNLKGSIRHN
jgi:hypothetical protein